MAGPAEILAAFRELSILKQITREELHGLLQDGIHAALAKKHGANVQAEVEIDEEKGAIRIVLLKTVVEEVTDPAREAPLEEARFMDPEFQIGDVMEIEVDFNEFGRTAVQAAKQRIVLIGNLLLVATSGHADQLTPGLFQKATRRGGLCHGHAQLTQKGLIGGRIKEGRYQPVQLSAGGFFVHGRRGGRRVQGQVHKG